MAVTWNSGDASANITLSGGSLTATTSSATQGAVRANTSFASGKQYFEVQLAVLSGSVYAVGWANATAALGTAMGSDTNAVTITPNINNSQTIINNVNLSTLGFAGAQFYTLCIAFDITNKLIWSRYNNGLWNGSATANPATGTGGTSTSTLAAGPYFPVFAANSSGASAVAYFGGSDMNYAVPSGFSTLDTNVQAYNASSKFDGYAVLDAPQAAASASKFDGYAVLDAPQNAASASKFLGYAVLLSAVYTPKGGPPQTKPGKGNKPGGPPGLFNKDKPKGYTTASVSPQATAYRRLRAELLQRPKYVSSLLGLALLGKITAQTKARAASSGKAALSGKITTQAKARGGFNRTVVLQGIVKIAVHARGVLSGKMALKAWATIQLKMRAVFQPVCDVYSVGAIHPSESSVGAITAPVASIGPIPAPVVSSQAVMCCDC